MAKPLAARSGQVIAASFGSNKHVVVGTLVRVDETGGAHVDYPGNTEGPLLARIVGHLSAADARRAPAVALAFDDGERTRPLILGVVTDLVCCEPIVAKAGRDRDLVIDGHRIELNADSELQLRCGNASILLRRDGKLVVKGTEVVSRASGANKIRGGVVNIN